MGKQWEIALEGRYVLKIQVDGVKLLNKYDLIICKNYGNSKKKNLIDLMKVLIKT